MDAQESMQVREGPALEPQVSLAPAVVEQSAATLCPPGKQYRAGVLPTRAEIPEMTGSSGGPGLIPLILTLSRGHYCPKEHQQHLDLAAFYPNFVAYTQIVTISTDDHYTLQEFRASVGAPWTFLSDPGRTLQKDLDIAEYTDPDHNPMIPHTLVLKPGLIIHTRIQTVTGSGGRPASGATSGP